MDDKQSVTFASYRDFKGYVISLDREKWRYEEARRKLTKAGFTNIERLSAIDYNTRDVNEEIRRMGARHLERFVSDAEIAVALSHFKAMHTFLAGPDEYCFIFEDDVIPVPDFRELSDFHDIHYGEFDLLCFGGAYSAPSYVFWGIDDASQLRQAHENNSTHINNCCFWQAHAYLINRKAAYKLLQDYGSWTRSEEYRHPHIDVYLSSHRGIKNKLICNQKISDVGQYMQGVKFAHRLCGIMFQEGDYDSTVNAMYHGEKKTKKLKPEDELTVIISGSYLDSHPEITFMQEVIESLELTGIPHSTPLILSHDKIKLGTEGIEEKEKAYQEYFKNLEEYIKTSSFNNITISQAPEWGHLTRTLKYAVSQVKTKYMLVLQHDIHIRREIPVLKMIDLMERQHHIKHLRFNVRRNHPTFMWWDGYHKDGHCIFAEEEYGGVKLCVTPAWSDQNHLATKEYYESVIFPDCTNPDSELIWDFMENRLNGLCHHNHDRYGTYIYGEYGAPRTSRHSDGRKSSPEADED